VQEQWMEIVFAMLSNI